MKQLIIFGILGFALLTAFLPTRTVLVQGRITDRSGTPLAAVSVTEQGTANITYTDAQGYYSITVTNSNVVLIFSSVGFTTRAVKLSGKSLLNIQLTASSTNKNTTTAPEHEAIELKSVKDRTIHETEAGSTAIRRTKSVTKAQNIVSGLVPGHGVVPAGSRRYPHPEMNTEDYDALTENRFLTVKHNPLSTFSIDVDAASYSNVRRYLNNGQLPPAGAVRTEELINYFRYDFPQPKDQHPFAVYTELSESPWNSKHQLAMVTLQGRNVPVAHLPASSLVFLIDVSGSMEMDNKLPLVKQSMKLLAEQLREQDKVAIVVYAGNAGLVLPATSGAHTQTIVDAIERLSAGGSTAGGAGIKLAYHIARQNFISGGNNRVILCTDGDFNVGVSSDAEMENLIEQERKSGIFLTVLGYGTGNYKDNKMQKLADKGNGNHAYIDNLSEAKKVLVSEFGGTLFTIAKDVKLQVEFNPARVQAYRLIGYENRMLRQEDFNNDQKDAGDMGSGHTVTALYEIIPVGVKSKFVETVDPLKYQSEKNSIGKRHSPELMTIKLRYKDPDGEKSRLFEHAVADNQLPLAQTSGNFRFAAAVAQFGMLLTHSEFVQQSGYNNVLALANSAIGYDPEGYRKGFLTLVEKAALLSNETSDRNETDDLKIGR